MKKTLILSALALLTISAANAATPDDNHFRFTISDRGLSFQLGDFHSWRWDDCDKRYIDRYGGRHVMTAGSLLGATMLALLGMTTSLPAFYAIWIGLGIAMSAVLYEPAFAVITACFGPHARKGITTLTLPGGLASTVFWPLTQALVAALDWRQAVFVLALFNLCVCAPLHWLFLPSGGAARARKGPRRGGADRGSAGPAAGASPRMPERRGHQRPCGPRSRRREA